MKAIQHTAPRQFAAVDLPKPEPDSHQVIIQVKTCGICRTDLTIRDGSFLVKFPLMNSHGFVGVIDSVDSAATEWKVGDRVTVSSTELCGYHEPCHSSKPLHCENFNPHGCNVPSGLAEYVLISRDRVFVLSDKLSSGEATFIGPTTCAVHGADHIAPRSGDSILTFDAGPTGIALAQLLHRAGAGRMTIANPHADKLDILHKYDFTNLVVIDKADPSKHAAEIKTTMPKGFDIIIDATGTASVFKSCFHLAHMGSKVVVYGVCAADAKAPASPYDIFSQEYTILGSFTQTHCSGRALEYLESGAVQVKELIFHELSLEDYNKGLGYIVQRQIRKAIIHP